MRRVLHCMSALLSGMPSASAQHASAGSIAPVSQALCDDMKKHNVIRAGARVGCERLSLVRFSYLGFDGAIHDDGEIMAMDAAAENVLRIFNKLRDIRFPIAKARFARRPAPGTWLRKDFFRFLLERRHQVDVRNRSVADA